MLDAGPILLGVESASSTLANEVKAEGTDDWKALPRHRDEDQVQLDVNKSGIQQMILHEAGSASDLNCILLQPSGDIRSWHAKKLVHIISYYPGMCPAYFERAAHPIAEEVVYFSSFSRKVKFLSAEAYKERTHFATYKVTISGSHSLRQVPVGMSA